MFDTSTKYSIHPSILFRVQIQIHAHAQTWKCYEDSNGTFRDHVKHRCNLDWMLKIATVSHLNPVPQRLATLGLKISRSQSVSIYIYKQYRSLQATEVHFAKILYSFCLFYLISSFFKNSTILILQQHDAGSVWKLCTLVTFSETKHQCLWQDNWAILPTLKWVAHSVMTLQWQWLGMECLFITSDCSSQQDRQKVQWVRTYSADKAFASQTLSPRRLNKSVRKPFIPIWRYT